MYGNMSHMVTLPSGFLAISDTWKSWLFPDQNRNFSWLCNWSFRQSWRKLVFWYVKLTIARWNLGEGQIFCENCTSESISFQFPTVGVNAGRRPEVLKKFVFLDAKYATTVEIFVRKVSQEPHFSWLLRKISLFPDFSVNFSKSWLFLTR